MKPFQIFVCVVFIGVVGFITYSLVKESHERYYATTRPEVATIEEKLALPGFIYPGKEIEIKPQISGVIDAVYVGVGDRVEEGSPIASVSLVPNSSEVEQLTSSVNISRINLEAARLRHERQKQLFEAKAVSHAEFEAVEHEYQTAQENYNAAEHQLNLRRKGRKSATNLVRSSTAGVIIDIPVKVGTSVMERSGYNPGSTVAVLAGTDHYVFRANVPEKSIGRLHVGMPVSLSLPALDSLAVDAIIQTISAKGEMQGGAVKFPVEAQFTFDGKDGTLRSGYSATATILLRQAKSVLTLPEKAVCFHGDTSFVYVTDSLNKAVSQRNIRIGLTDGVRVEILEGISTRDLVITNYHD